MKAIPLQVNPDREKPGERNYQVTTPVRATHVALRFPCSYGACRIIPVNVPPEGGGPFWNWNRDTCSPTLKPSILSSSPRYDDGEGIVIDQARCHSFVTNGEVRFLQDCTHELAGQTRDLVDISPDSPWW